MHKDIKDLPEHVSVFIDVQNFDLLRAELSMLGFRNTPFQIMNPGQIYAKILPTTFNNNDVELHVRCYHDGKLEAEYEPKRLGNIIQHLSRRSYSAHEFLIESLNHLNIEHVVDQQIRERYNSKFPKEFPKQKWKFFHWFFISSMIIYPLGILWRIQWEIKKKLRSRTSSDKSEEKGSPVTGN